MLHDTKYARSSLSTTILGVLIVQLLHVNMKQALASSIPIRFSPSQVNTFTAPGIETVTFNDDGILGNWEVCQLVILNPAGKVALLVNTSVSIVSRSPLSLVYNGSFTLPIFSAQGIWNATSISCFNLSVSGHSQSTPAINASAVGAFYQEGFATPQPIIITNITMSLYPPIYGGARAAIFISVESTGTPVTVCSVLYRCNNTNSSSVVSINTLFSGTAFSGVFTGSLTIYAASVLNVCRLTGAYCEDGIQPPFYANASLTVNNKNIQSIDVAPLSRIISLSVTPTTVNPFVLIANSSAQLLTFSLTISPSVDIASCLLGFGGTNLSFYTSASTTTIVSNTDSIVFTASTFNTSLYLTTGINNVSFPPICLPTAALQNASISSATGLLYPEVTVPSIQILSLNLHDRNFNTSFAPAYTNATAQAIFPFPLSYCDVGYFTYVIEEKNNRQYNND